MIVSKLNYFRFTLTKAGHPSLSKSHFLYYFKKILNFNECGG